MLGICGHTTRNRIPTVSTSVTFLSPEHHEYFNSDNKELTPEQKAHYGPTVRAHSTKTQPVYCPLLDTIFVFLAGPFHR